MACIFLTTTWALLYDVCLEFSEAMWHARLTSLISGEQVRITIEIVENIYVSCNM